MEDNDFETIVLSNFKVFDSSNLSSSEDKRDASSLRNTANLASRNSYTNIIGDAHRFRGFETMAIRSGYAASEHGEHSEAIYETSSYVYNSCEESYQKFSGQVPGNVYSRFTNPTVRTFEERLALLESAEDAIASSSGMSAILTVFCSLLRQGDKIICSANIFGSTRALLNNYIKNFGIDVHFVDICDYSAWEREILHPTTKLVFLESPANPTLEIADINYLAQLTKQSSAVFVVDNTMCTPCSQKPILIGADLVVHSTSKYIDGHGRCIGGCVAGRKDLIEKLRTFMRCAGPAMTAHNAWIFSKGLETLELRFERHSENALSIAKWLESHPKVAKVIYPGLESHPNFELAKRQQKYSGGIVSFILNGTTKDVWEVLDRTQLCSLTTNIGDTKTMITHPASTTHVKLSQIDRERIGVVDGLIRISVGLENVNDILLDLDYCLSKT